MLRSPSVSSVSLVPACGTQDPADPPQITLNGSGVSVPPSVKVELLGVVKSTWKRQSFQVGFVPISVNGLGAFAGGRIDPSKSAGMSWSSEGLSIPVLTIVVLAITTGVWLVIMGVFEIVSAFGIRKDANKIQDYFRQEIRGQTLKDSKGAAPR